MTEQPYILVVDDDPDILEGIIAVLETQDYRLETARDGLECMERIREETPDLVILDMLMPRMDGFAVIRELRADPEYSGLPIIVLTTVIEDAAYRRYELETGLSMDVHDFIEKPAMPAELLRRVSAVVDQPYILIADDDPDIVEAVTTILRSAPYQVGTARDGQQCLEMVRQRKPDVLILDLLMPRMDGFAVIRELQNDPSFSNMPIIVLTTVVEDASRRRYELETGRDLKVMIYLQKPVMPDELLRTVAKVLEGEPI
ncbi:MAG: response regulator [Anaerolineales bacterium]|nr:response regulator [Anaerolineales bacterium]